MRKKYELKVNVSGGKNTTEEQSNPKTVKNTITVDMKNQKVDDVIPNDETDKAKYYKALREMVYKAKMSVEDAAHMAILEIKRVYIDCIEDECSDVETITYLDGLIFNSLEKIIASIIESSLDVSGSYYADTYKEVLIGSIKNSVKLLNYEETFNFDKMIWNINRFVDDFKR